MMKHDAKHVRLDACVREPRAWRGKAVIELDDAAYRALRCACIPAYIFTHEVKPQTIEVTLVIGLLAEFNIRRHV